MKIRSIEIESYKPFRTSGVIEFSDELTVISGRNNSGKSSMLECLDFANFKESPFNGYGDDRARVASRVRCVVHFSGSELRDLIVNKNKAQYISLPVPKGWRQPPIDYWTFVFEQDNVQVHFSVEHSGALSAIRRPSLDLMEEMTHTNYIFARNSDGSLRDTGTPSGEDHLVAVLAEFITADIYFVRAMRNVLSASEIGSALNMLPTAANLPTCLFNLYASKPKLFEKLKMHVREIVPEIVNINFVHPAQNQIEVRVWLEACEPENTEIYFNLDNCGTGVAQILSLLFVAMNSSDRVIVIDEPNSFLHPGASKRLIEILREYKNQYIVSTHSPEIISRSNLDKLYLVRKERGESKAEIVSVSQVLDLKDVLSDLGVAFGDVFGIENIAWVEGETEQLCFPKILALSDFKKQISFIVVRNTGDFAKKGLPIETVIGIYERLSSVTSIYPTRVRFGFDREKMSDAQIADLEKRLSGRVKILPRRTFENYLINSAAISNVFNASVQDSGKEIEADVVTRYIEDNLRNYAPKHLAGSFDEMIVHADVPKMFSDMFSALSNATIEYKKTKHSPMILDCILQNDPETIRELRDFVYNLAAGND